MLKTKNIKWVVLSLLIISFSILVVFVLKDEVLKIDIKGYNFVVSYFMSDKITPIVKIFTNLGNAITLLFISVIALILFRKNKIGIVMTLNSILIFGLNQVLKFIIRRPRPSVIHLVNERGYSCPSGHAMVSLAFYGLLIYFIYKNINNKVIKWFLVTLLTLLIMVIGTSRIYLGVHYVSDIIAGFLISLSYLIIFISVYQKWECKMKSENTVNSFKYAFSGIISAFKSERNLIIHSFVTIIVIVAGIFLGLSITEWLFCTFAIFFVFVSELFNTAIEEAVNVATKKIDETAKIAKDVAAGAVLLSAVNAVIVGCFIFLPKIIALF